jgi:transcriptional regulator with XRE-family HTH domain
MSRKLPHYLRNERKRAGLSQRDIAALLGDRTVSKVSRYERRRRLPPLRMALAYEAILGKPVSELFGGTYEPIRAEAARRAKLLLAAPVRVSGNRREHQSRQRSIEAIASRR